MGLIDFLKRGFSKPRKKFRLLQVEPSMNCNLRCSMCPWTRLHSRDSIMAWEVFERVSSHFKEAQEVDFTGGGEPLLHPRLEEMIGTAKKSGCTVGFSTNATLLGRERASAVLDAGLDWIAYSVDAATPATYEKIRLGASFNQIIGNIERLRNLSQQRQAGKLRTMLFFVMMKENIHELPAMIDMAHSLGIDVAVAKNLDVILKGEDDEKRIFKNDGEGEVEPRVHNLIEEAKSRARDLRLPFTVYELRPCMQPVCVQDPLKTLFVGWDGSISPCISLAYIQDRWFGGSRCGSQRVLFGNIANDSLESIWNGAEYKIFRGLFLERLNRYTRDLISSTTLDYRGDNRSGKWPEPPNGCKVCYYLYGI